MATRDLKDLQTEASSTPVNKLQGHITPSTPAAKSHTPCYCCGGKQAAAQFKTEQCRGCNKVRHVVKMCHSKRRNQPQERVNPPTLLKVLLPSGEYIMYPVVEQQAPSTPLKTTEALKGKELHLEVDTGASYSSISETTIKALWDADDALPLRQTEVKLRTYTGQIHVLGSITVTAETPGQQACLPLLVVEGSGPSLLGRDWLAKLHLDWKEIFSVLFQRTLANNLEQHQKVFEPGLGTIKSMEAKLYVDPQAQPAFLRLT